MIEKIEPGERDIDIIGDLREEILRVPEAHYVKQPFEYEQELLLSVTRERNRLPDEVSAVVPYKFTNRTKKRLRKVPRAWFKPFYKAWLKIKGAVV